VSDGVVATAHLASRTQPYATLRRGTRSWVDRQSTSPLPRWDEADAAARCCT